MVRTREGRKRGKGGKTRKRRMKGAG